MKIQPVIPKESKSNHLGYNQSAKCRSLFQELKMTKGKKNILKDCHLTGPHFTYCSCQYYKVLCAIIKDGKTLQWTESLKLTAKAVYYLCNNIIGLLLGCPHWSLSWCCVYFSAFLKTNSWDNKFKRNVWFGSWFGVHHSFDNCGKAAYYNDYVEEQEHILCGQMMDKNV